MSPLQSSIPSAIHIDVFQALHDRRMVYGQSKSKSGASCSTGDIEPTDDIEPPPKSLQGYSFGSGRIAWTVEDTDDPEDVSGNSGSEENLTAALEKANRKPVGINGQVQIGGSSENNDDYSLSASDVISSISAPGSSFEIGWLGLFRNDAYAGVSDAVDRINSGKNCPSPQRPPCSIRRFSISY